MQRWVLYAFISMFFAGITSVIAKQGLHGISAELGMSLRTVFVFIFVLVFAAFSVSPEELKSLDKSNYLWLAFSGVATAISWVFYYKALKVGDVATVALIDKGSVVVAILMAWWLLKEAITMQILSGSMLIILGLWVISRK